MSGARIGFLVLAFVFAGLLGWGIKTGEMPEKYTDIDRARHPFLFWAGGAIYAALALCCLYAAVAG